MRLETKVILLQITNASVKTVSSVSGPNSISVVNGKEYVEFGIRPTEEASEFYKEYWVVDTELYLYLDDYGDVYIYNDDLENFKDFIDGSEHKIDEPFIYEGVSGDIEIYHIDLNTNKGTLRFMNGSRIVFEVQATKEERELFNKDYDKLFERMKTVYGK